MREEERKKKRKRKQQEKEKKYDTMVRHSKTENLLWYTCVFDWLLIVYSTIMILMHKVQVSVSTSRLLLLHCGDVSSKFTCSIKRKNRARVASSWYLHCFVLIFSFASSQAERVQRAAAVAVSYDYYNM